MGNEDAMSQPDSDFSLLWARVRAGCPEAAKEMHDRYSHHIRRIVRRRLHQRMRKCFDSFDFVQSVWASFFLSTPDHCAFESPEALIAFLARMTHNKVIDHYRQRMGTQRWNINQELSARERVEAPLERISNPDPSPSQEAIAREYWERLNAGQTNLHRRILDLLRQGHSRREVSDLLGIDRKVIYRFLHDLNEQVDEP
jgi:RNA polymerase sigma factor (sigma-70 family)